MEAQPKVPLNIDCDLMWNEKLKLNFTVLRERDEFAVICDILAISLLYRVFSYALDYRPHQVFLLNAPYVEFQNAANVHLR